MRSVTLGAGAFGVVDKSATAHVIQSDSSYCGRKIVGPVPTGGWTNPAGYHVGQHCIECAVAYRAENAAVPVCYEF